MAQKTESPIDSQNQNISKLGEMIKGIRVAMLATIDDHGMIRSRPMATQQLDFDGTLWFFTKANSLKTHEIQHDQHVNLNYANVEDNCYVSVSGRAELVRDPVKAKELWTTFYHAWFPQGLEDPELMLVKVKVEQAEYWDSYSSAMVHLVGFVKSMATGKQYESEDHQKLNLTG